MQRLVENYGWVFGPIGWLAGFFRANEWVPTTRSATFYNTRMGPENGTDQEFVAGLRLAIDNYLRAVDQWETAYQKYYRLPGYAAKISGDLESEHREYSERKADLERLLPRARRLCLKHRLRDPFRGLVRISLGRYAPQHRMDSAIGRNERTAATICLVELAAACRQRPVPDPAAEPGPEKGSLLRRLRDYFY